MSTIGRLHVLTDFWFQQRFSHADLARMSIDGGADTIQFRQKFGTIRHLIAQIPELSAVCAESGVPLLVDDHLELALLDGVTGVHLGQDDFPIHLARRVLGDDAIIGATATNLDQALQAVDEGASYIGFGPVYPTSSKANPASVKGIRGLKKVCDRLDIPVIAIAGITPERVAEVMAVGAHGVAVMTAITTAPDPIQATRAFATVIKSSVQSR